MLFLPIAAILVCLAACLLQFACLRSPDITETKGTRNGRKLTIVGLLVAALYMVYTLSEYGSVSGPHAIAAMLMGMGQLVFGMNSLLQHLWGSDPHLIQ